MRYDHRSPRRGGGRSASSRRQAPSRGRQDDYRRDRYDDDDDYDDLPPPRSNVLPWVVVSVLVIAAFALVVVLAAGGGGDDEGTTPGGPSAPKGPLSLRYAGAGTVKYAVKFKRTLMTKTEEADEPWNEQIRAVLTVTGGPGGGSAMLDVEHYEAGRSRQVRPQSDCPANGRPVAFTLGSHGGLAIAESDPDTLPTRIMLTALFPDLPDRALDPALGDTWTARSPEPLLALLPFPDAFRPDLKPFKSQFSATSPGDFEGRICVEISTDKPMEIHGGARTRHRGNEVDALLDGSGSGSMILELERGIPCQAVADFKGKITIHPFMLDKVRIEFKYGAQLNLLSN